MLLKIPKETGTNLLFNDNLVDILHLMEVSVHEYLFGTRSN